MAFVLKRGMSVGAMSAEDDAAFLNECLVDTADLENIASPTSVKSIALGRTGSGKSAILLELEKRFPNVVRINPEALSLNYISNSDVLSFFESLSINLDLFYQLLWRHILAVELIKLKKQVNDERTAANFIEALRQKFKNNEKKRRALDYLTKFGDKFWLDTELRVREVVENIEKTFEKSIGMNVEAMKARIIADLKDKDVESKKVTADLITRASKVVNEVQLQELNNIIELLQDDVFDDSYTKYFVIIDDLDTGWVHESIRFKLVRALIETLKKFRRLSNVKIVIGLRADLLETVIKNTQTAGFQTEKYEDMMLRLKWSRSELFDLADKRIGKLFKGQYQNKVAQYQDIFVERVGSEASFDYILNRTLHRPRDVIAFMNECLEQAAGAAKISANNIRNAELEYSKKRLRSMTDEWSSTFGEIGGVINLLRNMPVRFNKKDLSDSVLEGLCIELLAGDAAYVPGGFVSMCNVVVTENKPYHALRKAVIETLYLIGAVGVKPRSGVPYEWSYKTSPLLEYDSLGEESSFAIHPMLFRVFNKRADPNSIT